MATNVKILLRRGLRSEISADTLDAGELGYTTDSKQLYVGTAASSDEIVFDPFANAHSIVQTFLNEQSGPLSGLEIDEDLIIKNIPTLTHSATGFLVGSVYKIVTLGAETTPTVTAGSFVIGTEYTILVPGDTDFTLIGATDSVIGTTFTATGTGTGTGTATYIITIQEHWKKAGTSSELTSGYFVVGSEYIILTPGDTDYTLIGAANSAVGTTFTATGTGTGTGTALLRQFTATSKGTGTGEATTSGSIVLIATMRTHGITNAGYFIIGKQYRIKTVGTTDFTWDGFSNPITAGSFVLGTFYKILVPGDTDFTLIGAADSDVGTYFTATDVGTGTGTATTTGAIGDEFTATREGSGTGTVQTFETIAATAFVTGNIYRIKTVGTTDFTLIGLANNNITSGSFVIGTRYKIVTVGTTDFTSIGAANNNVGTVFTATGVGSGTGTATTIGAVGDIFEATGVGTGTGNANWDVHTLFDAHIFASERKNVEVLTENSFSQVYANMHLESHASATGKRSDLFKKELTTTSGTFLKYAKTDATSFFIDYSLKQVGPSDTFIRVGTIRVINGAIHEIKNTANTHYLTKLTDDNTEIWQDDDDGTAEADEFSNIEFTAEDIIIASGTHMKINYTQDVNFTTEISYTVKRWTM